MLCHSVGMCGVHTGSVSWGTCPLVLNGVLRVATQTRLPNMQRMPLALTTHLLCVGVCVVNHNVEVHGLHSCNKDMGAAMVRMACMLRNLTLGTTTFGTRVVFGGIDMASCVACLQFSV